ncbi:plexin-B1-like [Petromyzon marinus]|uniref:plexin-B1-like n=1 Tax=Petromyzon marinus TaxID=7757 RepID=UPI003F71F8BD
MDKEEVEVTIGEEQCKVEMMDSSSLYCKPPLTQPSARAGGDEAGYGQEEIIDRSLNCTLATSSTSRRRQRRDGDGDLPQLIVHMGVLRFPLGRVRYSTGDGPLSKWAIAGIAVGLLILLLAITALILLLRSLLTYIHSRHLLFCLFSYLVFSSCPPPPLPASSSPASYSVS